MSFADKRILVVDDEEAVRDILCMILESCFDCKAIECESAKEAIEKIKELKSVDLIISDYSLKSDNGGDLFNFVCQENSQIPFAICTGYSLSELKGFENFLEVNTKNRHISKPFQMNDVKDFIEASFENEVEAQSVDYVPIEVSRFLRLNDFKNPYEIFIRLGEVKFVKITGLDIVDSSETIKKYIDKGIKFVYMTENDFLDFNKTIFDSLLNKYRQTKEVGGARSEEISLLTDSISIAHEMVKKAGASSIIVEQIDGVMMTTLDSIQRDQSLQELLSTLDAKESYIKNHAYLTCYLACAIAVKMGWTSEGLWKDIIFAGLFQNITLEDNHEASIVSLESTEFKELKESRQNKVKSHPLDTEKILTNYGEFFSEETLKMIKSHHERPGEGGFPRGCNSSNISQIEALFILATNLSRDLLFSKNENELAQEYNETFNKNNFKSPFKGFLKAFTNLSIIDNNPKLK